MRVVLAQITLQIMALTYAVRNVMVASWDVLVDSLVRRLVEVEVMVGGDGRGSWEGRGGGGGGSGCGGGSPAAMDVV